MNTLSWRTLEHAHKERGADWVWYAGLVAVIVAILCFIFRNPFLGIFSIVAGVVVIMIALKHPDELEILLSKEGVFINDLQIPYSSITQFWLDEKGESDKLQLIVKGSFAPVIEIPLENVRAEDVRAFLLEKGCEEKEIRQSVSSALFHKIGF
jgi:lipid-A-disaccharide synthase-like uncharacterized protein